MTLAQLQSFVLVARARPRPHVTLWSSVADDLRAGRA